MYVPPTYTIDRYGTKSRLKCRYIHMEVCRWPVLLPRYIIMRQARASGNHFYFFANPGRQSFWTTQFLSLVRMTCISFRTYICTYAHISQHASESVETTVETVALLGCGFFIVGRVQRLCSNKANERGQRSRIKDAITPQTGNTPPSVPVSLSSPWP